VSSVSGSSSSSLLSTSFSSAGSGSTFQVSGLASGLNDQQIILIDSTLNANPAGYEEVVRLLAELREAWEQSTDQHAAAAAAVGA
jgi:hypothetical protein